MPQNAYPTWMSICQEKGYWHSATMPSPVPEFQDHYTLEQFKDALALTAKTLETRIPTWQIDDILSKLYDWPDV